MQAAQRLCDSYDGRPAFTRQAMMFTINGLNLSGGGTEAFVMRYSSCPPPDRFR